MILKNLALVCIAVVSYWSKIIMEQVDAWILSNSVNVSRENEVKGKIQWRNINRVCLEWHVFSQVETVLMSSTSLSLLQQKINGTVSDYGVNCFVAKYNSLFTLLILTYYISSFQNQSTARMTWRKFVYSQKLHALCVFLSELNLHVLEENTIDLIILFSAKTSLAIKNPR